MCVCVAFDRSFVFVRVLKYGDLGVRASTLQPLILYQYLSYYFGRRSEEAARHSGEDQDLASGSLSHICALTPRLHVGVPSIASRTCQFAVAT